MKKILYPNLVGEMAKHGDNQKTIAKILDITHASVCRRLSGKSQWTIGDIETLCNYFNKDYYELFKRND